MMNDILNNQSLHCPSGNHPTFTTYPITDDDEFRVKLATNRNAPYAITSIVTKENELVDPSNVFANSFMTPILRVYYHLDRNNNFGLTFVMIKAIYEPGPPPLTLMPTDMWEIDEEN